MTACCPNCGFLLAKLDEFAIGPLHVSGEFGMVTWLGQVPHITKTERLIVLALAGARGGIIRSSALIEAGGFDEIGNPENQLAVMLHRIKDAFRAIDPAFDRIRNERGIGYRWAIEAGETHEHQSHH